MVLLCDGVCHGLPLPPTRVATPYGTATDHTATSAGDRLWLDAAARCLQGMGWDIGVCWLAGMTLHFVMWNGMAQW